MTRRRGRPPKRHATKPLPDDPIKAFAAYAAAQPPEPVWLPPATADTWISRDGVRTRVVDMDSGHLYRWIAYFRRKYQQQGFIGRTLVDLDAYIQQRLITGPAIYAEAARRGIYDPSGGGLDPRRDVTLPAPEPPRPTTVAAPIVDDDDPGFRKIRLGED